MLKKVCVIGAGLSGLATIKELRDEFHTVVCYEQAPQLGGVFRQNNNQKNPAYDEYALTNSNYFMAFSSMQPEDSDRRYWTRTEYHQYLQKFASRFELYKHISFHTQVTEIERRHDGKWLVRSRLGTKHQERIFDVIAICTGKFRVPFIPSFAGLADFQGTVKHSFDYDNAASYRGKHVVCVGLGESGADICHQIAQVAEQTTLVVRHPPFILPRSMKEILGVDETSDAAACRYFGSITSQTHPLSQAIFHLLDPFSAAQDPELRLISEWNRMSNHYFGKFPVKNDIFVPDIISGKLGFNLFGVERMGVNSVVCGDGQEIDADVVICNTGFRDDFSLFINAPQLKEIEGNIRRLYKHIFHPEFGASLAFIGFVRPDPGGLAACVELQARYLASLCSGKCHLPDRQTLETIIEKDAQAETSSFYERPNVSESVRYVTYTSELAELIGCQPQAPILNPKLLLKYHFGSAVSSWFRLSGPGSKPSEAQQVIKKLPVAFSGSKMASMMMMKLSMDVAPVLDNITSNRISGWVSQQQTVSPLGFLRREFRKNRLNQKRTLRSLCPDVIVWQNLKYKLCQQFALSPREITEGMTVAQFVERCREVAKVAS